MTRNPRWTPRLQMTSTVVHIVGFLLAVVGTTVSEGLTTQTAIGYLAASIGVVLGVTVRIPISIRDRTAIASIVASVVLFAVAIGLTGGASSSFVVMPLASIFLASMGGGVRVGAPTAILAIAGVLLAAWISEEPTSAEALIRIPAIYVITALAFSEVQRALMSESERADDLVFARETSENRRERLEATHDLLEDLLRLATSPDVNAVAAAQDALRGVGVVFPDAPGRIVGVGNVNLARKGDLPETDATHSFPITASGIELARLDLWLGDLDITPSQRAAVDHTVSPVALAIENDAMVQQLAGVTIQRERVRLARELHDDIAPSIASVGLALDMVLLGDGLDTDQQRTLEATRATVTRLVDRIRARVQDLRADRSVSIVEVAHSLVAEVDADGPTVVVDIDERTPPRPAIAVEVGALITEAFRNSLRHADATVIAIRGNIEEGRGRIEIVDNGVGFDVGHPADGRYGLTGMKERASLIGADLDVSSTTGDGTSVVVAWREAT